MCLVVNFYVYFTTYAKIKQLLFYLLLLHPIVTNYYNDTKLIQSCYIIVFLNSFFLFIIEIVTIIYKFVSKSVDKRNFFCYNRERNEKRKQIFVKGMLR